ncbi:MAG: hypothetical protein RIB60_11390 [Phycisphaerales bacterium]
MIGLLIGGSVAIAEQPRPLTRTHNDQWIGDGISYGPHRDGQAPGGASPTREQIREDLRILAGRFSLIRMYGSVGPAADALDIIREDGLSLRVMVGAWIAPNAEEANRAEVEAAIRLANEYPEIVWAVNVGNETQVYWSAHRVPAETLIELIRDVRRRVSCPVTTCDDYNFWNRPESAAVAAEVDFIGLHAYAMWNTQTLANALEWTREQIDDVASRHAGLPIVLCETGWATSVASHGQQAELIIGAPGEREQELFYRAFASWAKEAEQPYFYFEAFDENWKGGDDPAEVEKHWGLWRADRTPKLAAPTAE